jgi:hypothetical protein
MECGGLTPPCRTGNDRQARSGPDGNNAFTFNKGHNSQAIQQMQAHHSVPVPYGGKIISFIPFFNQLYKVKELLYLVFSQGQTQGFKAGNQNFSTRFHQALFFFK